MINTLKNITNQLLIRQNNNLFGFLKGLFLAVTWQLYKRTFGFPIIIQTYTDTSFILRRNCITSSRFVYEGKPDAKYIGVLGSFASAEAVFVDVGANVGLYSVLLCRDFEKAILFEPNPIAATMLMQNIAVNEKINDYKIYEAAVGAENGKVSFPVLENPLPTASITMDNSVETIERDMYCLDDILEGGDEFVIKIDAEGFDAEVIMGLARCLENKKVRICLFECHNLGILKKVYDFIFVENRYSYSIYDESRKIDVLDDFSQKKNRDIFIVRSDLANVYLKHFENQY